MSRVFFRDDRKHRRRYRPSLDRKSAVTENRNTGLIASFNIAAEILRNGDNDIGFRAPESFLGFSEVCGFNHRFNSRRRFDFLGKLGRGAALIKVDDRCRHFHNNLIVIGQTVKDHIKKRSDRKNHEAVMREDRVFNGLKKDTDKLPHAGLPSSALSLSS